MIDGVHEMSYDFLILSPGMQYHPPTPIGIDPKFIAERLRKNSCEPSRFSITTSVSKWHKFFSILLIFALKNNAAIQIEQDLLPFIMRSATS